MEDIPKYSEDYDYSPEPSEEKSDIDTSSITIIVILLLGFVVLLKQLIDNLRNKSYESSKPKSPQYQPYYNTINPNTQAPAWISSMIQTNFVVTSVFNEDRTKYRTAEQIKQGKTKHKGIDLAVPVGTPIRAPFDGTIVSMNNNTSGQGGRWVQLESNDGVNRVMLAHLSAIDTTKKSFKVGDILAYSGASGHGSENYYGPHIHLQVSVKNKNKWEFVDPLKYDVTTNSYTSVGITNPSQSIIQPTSTEKPQQSLIGIKQNPLLDKIEQSRLPSLNIHPTKYGKLFNYDKKVKIIFNKLKNLSLDTVQVSGIIGNLMVESNLDPIASNGTGGGYGAQGIAQWRGPRIESYVKIYKKDLIYDNSFEHQVDFLIHELSGTFSRVLSSLKNSKSISKSTEIFYKQFEKPSSSDKTLPKRIQEAEKAYKLLKEEVSANSNSHKHSNVSNISSTNTTSKSDNYKRKQQ